MGDRVTLSWPGAGNTRQRPPWACHLMAGLALLGTACQQVEQGYWTKPGMSQTQFNTEYRRDFRECAHQGFGSGTINDTGPESDTIRARHVSGAKSGTNKFNDCMYSHGYDWVTMQPLVGANARGSTVNDAQCPRDQIIIDPYGYPHCASQNTIHPARSIDVPREASLPLGTTEPTTPSAVVSPETMPLREQIPEPAPRKPVDVPPENRTMGAARESGQRRSFDESLCIQHSQASLSNPYETFLRCMEEKGWPTGPR
jgi:hypothetical protein